MASAFDLHWHWRAWRAQERWSQSKSDIEAWLCSQPKSHECLLLLGGSAGWMMSDRFLDRFTRVVLMDMDPLAGPLFRLRHRRALQGSRKTFVSLKADMHVQLPQLLEDEPHALVLFDNLLGLDTLQTRSIEATQRRLSALSSLLEGRDWGSIHDRFSGPGGALPPLSSSTFHRLSDEAFSPTELIRVVGGSGEWTDHSTHGIFPGGVPTRFVAWPIVPGYWHWLQAGWVGPSFQGSS
ncbi:MAG: hypothetical protein EBQ76_07090 [Betaproteobacteria bacterium]|nr:hypothetical protein [Betaproteobacteria bacterium]